MYAIIQTGGKQYRVQEGDIIFIEKLELEDGAEVNFDQVLMVGDEAETRVGTPLLEGASVLGKVQKTGKSKKILVFKYKAKKNYRRRQGHRQPYTKVEILSVKA